MRFSAKAVVRGLKTLLGWTITAIVRVVLSIVFLFLFLTLALDKIALGPGFNMAIIATVAVAICITLLLNVFSGRVLSSLERRFNDLSLPSLSPRVSRLLSGLGAIVLVGLSLGILVWFNSHQSRTVADAESAFANFQVNYAKGVDLSRLNQTLAEFERARRSLELIWPNPADSPPITLRLFGSIEEYHAIAGRHYSAGLALCSPTGAVVWVPLEQAIELPGEEDYTRTPLHEMVHAMMCQHMGREAFYSVPRWFHEGMAESYQNEARHLRWERITNRLFVWVHSDELMAPEPFCTESFVPPESEIGLFYMTVLEFARSLESEHGRDSLLAVVDDVRNGMDFEGSIHDHFGSTCVDLYGNWLESW